MRIDINQVKIKGKKHMLWDPIPVRECSREFLNMGWGQKSTSSKPISANLNSCVSLEMETVVTYAWAVSKLFEHQEEENWVQIRKICVFLQAEQKKPCFLLFNVIKEYISTYKIMISLKIDGSAIHIVFPTTNLILLTHQIFYNGCQKLQDYRIHNYT